MAQPESDPLLEDAEYMGTESRLLTQRSAAAYGETDYKVLTPIEALTIRQALARKIEQTEFSDLVGAIALLLVVSTICAAVVGLVF